MNFIRYQELFEYSSCPVFVFSERGKILYKNQAAKKYFPMLRKNAYVTPHLYPSVIPTDNCLLHIVGDTPYRRVVAMRDGFYFIAFGFVRLQLSDGRHIAELILRQSEDPYQTMQHLFYEKKALSLTEKSRSVSRVYTDIFETLHNAAREPLMKNDAFDESVNVLFEKLNMSFHALGYRIDTKIEGSFVPHRSIRWKFNDLLFVFGIFLYMQMRFSENGDILISLGSESQKHILRLCVKTEISDAVDEDAMDFLKKHFPECAWELHLLEQIGVLMDENFRLLLEDYGNLTIEIGIPLGEEAVSSLQSETIAPYVLLTDIHHFLGAIERWLKDNDAFC